MRVAAGTGGPVKHDPNALANMTKMPDAGTELVKNRLMLLRVMSKWYG